MTTMNHDRREGWTGAELALGGTYLVLCPLIGFFAFVVIFQTVTHLVHPWFGDWSWIVPASGEGVFIATYAGWLLLELRDPTAPRHVPLLIMAILSTCAAGSYWLNVSAAHGIVADAVAHAIVVTAFYGVLVLGKILVHRLKVTPAERALEAAMADARQYAVDLLRVARGRWWRWRGDVPSLLRRQVIRGRLCHEVREAVRLAVSVGRTSGWETEVRGWVFGPDGLNLAALAEEASRLALSEILTSGSGDDSRDAAGEHPQEPSGSVAPEASPEVSRTTPAGTPETPPRGTPKSPRVVPAKATDAELAELVAYLFDGTAEVKPYGVIKAIKDRCNGKGIGYERAVTVLELARSKQGAEVVQMEARRA